jgi:crotonobetainyl-CoA:carnitine CoA-transferase CaiB-like acyl-CoA transferase
MNAPEQDLLDELVVVDLSNDVATAFCTKLFAAAGAHVVMVEPVEGSALRSFSACGTEPDDIGTPMFHHLAAGKQSVIGQLGDPVVTALVEQADLIVESDLDAASIELVQRLGPRAVLLSITPYGRTGPWTDRPATDITIQAESGATNYRGPQDRPPIQSGGHISPIMAGAAAAAAALGAVFAARESGTGEHVDVAWLDVMAIAGSNYLDLQHSIIGRPPITGPLRTRDTPGIEQASDGLVGLNTNTGHMFEMFLTMIDRVDLLGEARYARLNERIAMGSHWQQIIDAWTTRRTVADIIEQASALRIPVAPVHDGRTVVDDEQYSARGMFTKDRHGRFGIANPFLVEGTRPDLAPAPPPGDERPLPAREQAATDRTAERPSGLPLEGVRVVDLTNWWVGGLATQTLAALGAEVIHVESIQRPDGMRLTGWSPEREHWWEWGHMFVAASTNKLDITLDLSGERGRSLLRSLIARSDVLVENYAPRVTEAWGLTANAVHEINERLVHLRMPGFGLTGPWRDRPAFAQIIEPLSTLASITGYPGERPVSKGGLPDPLAGWHGAFLALAGLLRVRRRGDGVAIETCMAEIALHACAEPALEWSTTGRVLGVAGNRFHAFVPQGVYRARGEDEWVAISVQDEVQWSGLVELIGAKGLDPGLGAASIADRRDRHDEIDAWISRWSASREPDHAVGLLAARGIPAGRCRDPRVLSEHPQLQARRLFEMTDHAIVGPHLAPAPPFRYSTVDHWLRRPSPTLGADNHDVLTRILGLDQAEIEQLETEQIIGTRPIGL